MIRGQTRPLPVAAEVENPNEIKAKFNASIHNRFDIEVVDAKTGEIKQRAQAENVICKNYWKYIWWSQENTYQYVSIGSGDGVPSANDTTLFTHIAAIKSDKISNIKINDTTYSFKDKITLNDSQYIGNTIREIGLSNGNGELKTHAMLQDMNGNPISILKTGTDVINIYATIFLHFTNTNGVTFIETSPTTPYDFYRGIAGFGLLLRPTVFNFRTIYKGINSQSYVGASFSQTHYPSNLEKYVTFTAPRLPFANGNFPGGLTEIVLEGYYGSKCQDIVIPVSAFYAGDDIIGEPVGTGDGIITDFATDFIQASNIKVYVNGVLQASGVTFDAASNTISNNIHFAEAPASGAVITADYHTDVIAKDENHVFDFSMEIQLGEYAPTI